MRVAGLIFAISLIMATNGAAQDAVPAADQDVAPTSDQEAVLQTEATPDPSWQICNETSFILRLAVAQTEGDVTNIDGWRRLRPSECISENPSAEAARFLYAESDPVHNGGIREWDGQIPICVNPIEDFEIESTVSCALQGLETRRFLKIDPEESVTKLIEPDNFGSKSETAGIQRLLQDAGYKISRVDGISGRRTRNTLRDFLKEHDVPSTASIFEQMDALAESATATQETLGLTVCNDSETEAWLALGYREDGSWQSRGWWSLLAGACIRPWSKNIQGAEMHIYAQQNESDTESRVLKTPVGVETKFCVAEAKFSALGREYCTDQGYVSEVLRPVVTDQKALKKSLTSDDFVTGQSSGLRQ